MTKKVTEQKNPSTPLEELLQNISSFDAAEVLPVTVAKAAFKLAVASADPKYAEEKIHIENGIERLGGIAARDNGTSHLFIDAVTKAKEFAEAAPDKFTKVTPHVDEVVSNIHKALIHGKPSRSLEFAA